MDEQISPVLYEMQWDNLANSYEVFLDGHPQVGMIWPYEGRWCMFGTTKVFATPQDAAAEFAATLLRCSKKD